MHIAQRIRWIMPAMIDIIKNSMAELSQEGAPIINLGQAIPNFPPPPAAIEAARKALDETDTHLYSPDAGILPLRQALSETLEHNNGIQVDPQDEILITAGANQAFLMALLTLLEPGDRVLLPSPFFFNHEMAVGIAGGIPIEVPLTEETGFQLRMADLEPYLEPLPRALVIVTPNNPTGAVYEPDELARVCLEMADRGITIITDETYQHFTYNGAQHLSPASIPQVRPGIVTIGSFSKSYSMTGWRIGYLLAESTFIEQSLKVQDTMVICAPVISQKAALAALRDNPQRLVHHRELLAHRRRLLVEEMVNIPSLSWQATRGSFFAFVKVKGCTDSAQMAMDILENAHVATIPGSLFGMGGEGYLRLSYGSVEAAELKAACHRLARFFRSTG